MSYIILKGDVILNVYEPSEYKSDDTKATFYKEVEHVYNKF
jgi:hypothetical protein